MIRGLVPLQDLYDKPGYQIRRLRQIAASIFAEHAAPFGVTSQQYTTLHALGAFASLEQYELCEVVSLDRSTMATLLVRLEEKGLVRRSPSKLDKRRRHVMLTPRGRRLLDAMAPVLAEVQERILAPLPPADRVAFERILKALVERHDAATTASAAVADAAS